MYGLLSGNRAQILYRQSETDLLQFVSAALSQLTGDDGWLVGLHVGVQPVPFCLNSSEAFDILRQGLYLAMDLPVAAAKLKNAVLDIIEVRRGEGIGVEIQKNGLQFFDVILYRLPWPLTAQLRKDQALHVFSHREDPPMPSGLDSRHMAHAVQMAIDVKAALSEGGLDLRDCLSNHPTLLFLATHDAGRSFRPVWADHSAGF